MIEPGLALVRPRVMVPGSSDALPLEDEVRSRLSAGWCGFIELTGPMGSGKTTAVAHLLQCFASLDGLLVADRPDVATLVAAGLMEAGNEHLVIYTSPTRTALRPDEVWQLAGWGTDECIEYLLAAHHDACGSVMRRLQSDPSRNQLSGLPALWRVVLDRMAVEEELADVNAVLRREIAARLPDAAVLAAARLWCFTVVCHARRESRMVALDECEGIGPDVCRIVRHAQVKKLLAADHVCHELRSGNLAKVLAEQFPESLVRETAAVVRGKPDVVSRLDRVLAGRRRQSHAMAASLLHAIAGNWVPQSGAAPRLSGAYLAGARWPGIQLTGLQVHATDLAGADLAEARLSGISADHVDLTAARLHGAQLDKLSAKMATLVRCDLSFARAPLARFDCANLQDANLEGALFEGASFRQADLCGARCCRGDFSGASFSHARLAGADFTGANLSKAGLMNLALREATFSGAQFASAHLDKCDLEGMRLPGANFHAASLPGALLTGTQMPDASFRAADLRHTGLADIDWERADLRDADLRGATFHLGSSRSGLVGSPIASEGSRTGFYTDEFYEQEFKAPEEIRKANLCGADLRGANIEGVDFYLVDLRGATYTSEQEAVFRACRAILEARV